MQLNKTYDNKLKKKKKSAMKLWQNEGLNKGLTRTFRRRNCTDVKSIQDTWKNFPWHYSSAFWYTRSPWAIRLKLTTMLTDLTDKLAARQAWLPIAIYRQLSLGKHLAAGVALQILVLLLWVGLFRWWTSLHGGRVAVVFAARRKEMYPFIHSLTVKERQLLLTKTNRLVIQVAQEA